MIAFNDDEMSALSRKLGDAASELRGATPGMPAASVFGSADLAAAASAFYSAVGRDARDLHDRCSALGEGVQQTAEEMRAFEGGVVAALGGMAGGLE